MTTWAILTGEYPPQPGGVSDYTLQVCRGLAAAGSYSVPGVLRLGRDPLVLRRERQVGRLHI